MLKIQHIFLKLYRCFLYVVFHNSEPKNVDFKKNLNLKRSKGIFVRGNLKNKHRYKNVIGSEDTLMHKAERQGNYFFQHYHT